MGSRWPVVDALVLEVGEIVAATERCKEAIDEDMASRINEAVDRAARAIGEITDEVEWDIVGRARAALAEAQAMARHAWTVAEKARACRLETLRVREETLRLYERTLERMTKGATGVPPDLRLLLRDRRQGR